MADPIPTPQDLSNTSDAASRASRMLAEMSTSALTAQMSLGDLNEIAENARGTFNAFSTALASYGVSINTTKTLTGQQTTQFGLLTTAILGTRRSFDSLNNIDTSSLSGFTDQIKYMVETLGDTKSGIGQLINIFQIPKGVVDQGVGAVKSFALSLAQSADNALRLQNAYIQLSAKTGNLSEVFDTAGPKLTHLNALLERQTAMMSNSIKATGLAPEVIQKYYSELGSIPKALEETVISSGSADKNVSMLTATIKTAMGTGRSYTDVIDDMKLAFKDYNITGEKALEFSTRMSEISNKFGINLDVVRDSLRSTANTFKMFGNEAEASARILNQYVGALKSTGISGDAAVEVVTSMTGALGGLNIAQKSFLSAQTGGPGGLMGAFQIEKMMREGKMDEVFEKVREQMQKQFGSIVSLDDASRSQAGAAQLTRQMMILKQGPLGQFAKTDQEAIRILEGFKAKQEGRSTPSDLSGRIVQESMSKGTLIQEKSYTELSKIRGTLESMRGTTDISNLGFMQSAFTASAGTPLSNLSEAQEKSRTGLTSFMSGTANTGGKQASDYAAMIANKTPVEQTGRRAVEAINEFQKMFTTIPLTMRAPLDALKAAIESDKTMNIESELKELKAEIDKAKEEAAKKPKEEQAKALATIKQQENILKSASQYYLSSTGIADVVSPIAPGAKVGVTASRTAGTMSTTAASAARATAAASTTASSTTNAATSNGDITVHVTGYCIKCKNEIDGGQQAASLNPAGTNI